jgi:hypothetical protein
MIDDWQFRRGPQLLPPSELVIDAIVDPPLVDRSVDAIAVDRRDQRPATRILSVGIPHLGPFHKGIFKSIFFLYLTF